MSLIFNFSGLSPFLDDSLDETNANIMRGDFSFPEEYFARVSQDAKDLIKVSKLSSFMLEIQYWN